MSYLKKISSLLLTLSLLSIHPQEPTKKSYTAIAVALSFTGGFIGVSYLVDWYHNCYKIDHLSIEDILENLENRIMKAQGFINTLSSNNSLDKIITNIYPHFPYPYLTCHAQLEKIISELIYYKNALSRKISQKIFTDNTIIFEVSQLIENLEYIQFRIADSSQYKDEACQRDESTF